MSKVCCSNNRVEKSLLEQCRLDGGISLTIFISKSEEDLVLGKIGANRKEDCKKAYRIVLQGKKIYSENYKRMKKRHCHTVLCQDAVMFTIKYFIQNIITGRIYAVGHRVGLKEIVHHFDDVGYHIINTEMTMDTEVVSADLIREELFVMKIHGTSDSYVCRVPNLYGQSVIK